ncbi:MAG: DUF4344 domain-containing metallopeptidase [Ahniella sp.]|nr:DUF4344 domain-containing metallopeptidase [Ahniella sp.]
MKPKQALMALFLLVCTGLLHAAPRAGFYADYQKVTDPDFKEWNTAFRKERALEGIAEELNSMVRIPSPIALSLEECGEANAFYDPEARRVSLCYEMASELIDLFGEDRSEEEVDDLVSGTMMFFLGHEVGHALTDVLDLPITGREEDAADQLAVLMLSDGSEDSELALIAAAETFATWAEDAEADEDSFADEHSLDEQRLYNILCWSYGRDPEAYEDFVTDGLLPEDRADGCAEEFERLERSWNRLLEEHLITDSPMRRRNAESDDQEEAEEEEDLETVGYKRR